MDYGFIIQLIFGGLVWGCAYALLALGLTIIYGMMGIVNMSHGEFYMIAAFFLCTFVTLLGLNFFVGVILALVSTMILGVFVERFIIRPVIGAPIINSTLLTIGMSIVIKNAAQMIWGPMPISIASPFSPFAYQIGPIAITQTQIFIIIVTVLSIVSFNIAIKKTRLGKAMRATFQDREVAALNGIRIKQIYSITFMLGSLMAAVAGVLLGPVFSVYPEMGSSTSLKAWAIVVMGGLGNFSGAIVGGLILGVVESLGIGLINSGISEAIVFIAVICVLLVRPYGLFGEKRL